MRSASFWPELQVEYVLKNTSFFYFRNHYRHNFDNDFNHLREDKVLRSLERVQFRAGYEYVFTNQWSGGINTSYAMERTRNILFNEIYGRHLSTFGKTRFSQRASFEHILRWPTNTSGRIRFRTDLDRNFNIRNKVIRPRIAYELFFNLDYHPTEKANNPKRLVDRTRLRFEVQYLFSDKFSIAPYFTEQVDFTSVKPTYDDAGTITRLGGNQNNITPIIGLDIRYVFFRGGKPFSRVIKDVKND